MEVILVRHTSVAVPPGTCYGQADVDVADTFEQEAAQTRQRLETYGALDAVFSSPLQRARKLAAYCGYSQPVTDSRLMEMSMGEWEMKSYNEMTDLYSRQWFDNYLNLPTPGGESFPQLRQRVEAFLDELKAKPFGRVGVFAHGGVLVCAGLYGGLFGLEEAYSHQVPYGGVERIVI